MYFLRLLEKLVREGLPNHQNQKTTRKPTTCKVCGGVSHTTKTHDRFIAKQRSQSVNGCRDMAAQRQPFAAFQDILFDDYGNKNDDSGDSDDPEEFVDDFLRENRDNEKRGRREMRGLLPPMPGNGVNSVGNVGVAAAAVGVDPAPVGVAEPGEAAAVPSEWYDTWTDFPIGPWPNTTTSTRTAAARKVDAVRPSQHQYAGARNTPAETTSPDDYMSLLITDTMLQTFCDSTHSYGCLDGFKACTSSLHLPPISDHMSSERNDCSRWPCEGSSPSTIYNTCVQ